MIIVLLLVGRPLHSGHLWTSAMMYTAAASRPEIVRLRQCTPSHCSVLSVPLSAKQEGERGLVGAGSWRVAMMMMMMIYNRE